jgi:hypothetical protein
VLVGLEAEHRPHQRVYVEEIDRDLEPVPARLQQTRLRERITFNFQGGCITPTGSTNDSFDDFAVNAAGEMAISSRADEWGVVYVAKLDAAGELVAVHPCTPSFSGTRVAIDDAGAVYLIGGGFDGSSSLQFVAAFD